MAKHATKFSHLQLVDSPRSVAVQVQLFLLGALGNAENAFFELCVEVGQQVFSVLMEQDQESLCGPKGKHDPERRAHRAGSTPSDITLGQPMVHRVSDGPTCAGVVTRGRPNLKDGRSLGVRLAL